MMNVFILLITCMVAQPTTLEQRLVKLGAPQENWVMLKNTAVASPDARHIAYQARGGQKLAYLGIILNDRWHQTTRRTSGLYFNDQSQLVHTLQRDGLGFIHVGGQSYPLLKHQFQSAPKVSFNAEGTLEHAVILAQHKRQQYVIDRDQPHPKFEAVDFDRLAFSGDGKTLAYPARSIDGWHIVINGKPGPAWRNLKTGPIFPSQGSRLIYTALASDGWHVVDRGNPGPAYPRVEPPVISHNGEKLAFWATHPSGRWLLIVDEQAKPIYASASPGQIAMSDDGSTLAVMTRRNQQWQVVVNGQAQKSYPALGADSLTVSRDGYHIAYAVKDRGERAGWWFVHDGESTGPYTQIMARSIQFSPDGQHVVCIVMQNRKWYALYDGQLIGPYTTLDPATFTFTNDSQHLAWIASRHGETFVVLDGQTLSRPRNSPNASHLRFSPNSQHLAWLATDENGQVRLYLDGQPSQHPFDRLLHGSQPVWASNTEVRLIGMTNRHGKTPPTFWRLEMNLDPHLPLADVPTP